MILRKNLGRVVDWQKIQRKIFTSQGSGCHFLLPWDGSFTFSKYFTNHALTISVTNDTCCHLYDNSSTPLSQQTLNKLFIDWLDANPRLFPEKAHLDVGQINLTMFDEVNEHLTEKYGKKCAICGYDYEKCFGEETAKENHLSVPFDLIVSKDLPHLIYRICNNCQRAGNDLLAQTLARKK